MFGRLLDASQDFKVSTQPYEYIFDEIPESGGVGTNQKRLIQLAVSSTLVKS